MHVLILRVWLMIMSLYSYKSTYALLRQHCDDLSIRTLLASSSPIDIKTIETALEEAAEGAGTNYPSSSFSPLQSRDPMHDVIEPSLMTTTNEDHSSSVFSLPIMLPEVRRSSTPNWADSLGEPLAAGTPLYGDLRPVSDVDELDEDDGDQ